MELNLVNLGIPLNFSSSEKKQIFFKFASLSEVKQYSPTEICSKSRG